MSALFDGFAWALSFFYSVVPSYGFGIIALTLVVMALLTPLTLKGTRSMMVMQQLQPEIKKLQSRYKDDRQKLNEELLKFYQENNINPLGGCLPLLVQMPVFVVLYQVLRGLTLRVPTVGTNPGWVSGQLGTEVALSKPPNILRPFDPAYLNHSSKLYEDLAGSTTMDFLGMDLAETASEALGRGIGHALPYLLLIVVVGVTGFVQQRQVQGRNPQSQMNTQQQQIMKFLPIFLPLISFTLPSGLVLYFAVSNLWRVGMQAFISRSIYGIKRGQNGSAGAGGGKGSSPPEPDPAPASGPKGSGGRGTARSGAGSGAAKGGGSKKATATATAPGDRAAPGRSPARGAARTKANAAPGNTSTEKATGKAAPKATERAKTGSKARSSGGSKPAGSGGPGKKPGSGGGSRGASGSPALQPRARKKKR